ncbi:MAG: response regulator, partial [Desulfovibrio sp.]|nr:response regulator [Desulfovibrio sp.]
IAEAGSVGGQADEIEDDDANLNGIRVLLVEDNPLNREIAVDVLQEFGAEVDEAENGRIAVWKIEDAPQDRYDIVLMDVQMPVMDGYEATRAIRGLGDGRKSGLPIIAMTANAFDEDRQNAKEAGMNDHLAKPVDVRRLKNCLKRFAAKA